MSKIKDSKDTNAEQQKRRKKKSRKFKCRKHKYRTKKISKCKNVEMYEQQENKNVLKHCINDIMMVSLILLNFLLDCRTLWEIKYGYKLYINTRLLLNFKS